MAKKVIDPDQSRLRKARQLLTEIGIIQQALIERKATLDWDDKAESTNASKIRKEHRLADPSKTLQRNDTASLIDRMSVKRTVGTEMRHSRQLEDRKGDLRSIKNAVIVEKNQLKTNLHAKLDSLYQIYEDEVSFLNEQLESNKAEIAQLNQHAAQSGMTNEVRVQIAGLNKDRAVLKIQKAEYEEGMLNIQMDKNPDGDHKQIMKDIEVRQKFVQSLKEYYFDNLPIKVAESNLNILTVACEALREQINGHNASEEALTEYQSTVKQVIDTCEKLVKLYEEQINLIDYDMQNVSEAEQGAFLIQKAQFEIAILKIQTILLSNLDLEEPDYLEQKGNLDYKIAYWEQYIETITAPQGSLETSVQTESNTGTLDQETPMPLPETPDTEYDPLPKLPDDIEYDPLPELPTDVESSLDAVLGVYDPPKFVEDGDKVNRNVILDNLEELAKNNSSKFKQTYSEMVEVEPSNVAKEPMDRVVDEDKEQFGL